MRTKESEASWSERKTLVVGKGILCPNCGHERAWKGISYLERHEVKCTRCRHVYHVPLNLWSWRGR